MRLDFSQENKAQRYDGFPKLKLDMNERARVAILENPLLSYAHTLSMPVVDPATGEVLKERKESKKTGEYFVDKMKYVRKYICDGDPQVVREKGADPEGCALCKAMMDHAGKFDEPKAYYTSHVIKYKVNSSGQVQEPFQAELLLWTMTQYKLDILIDIGTEFAESGGIRGIDLLLGPCASKDFQTFDIKGGNSCYWTSTPERQNFVKQLVEANRATDEEIRNTVAPKQNPMRVKADVETVLERYSMIGRPQTSQQLGEFGGMASASVHMDEGNSPWGEAPNSGSSDPWGSSSSAPSNSGSSDPWGGGGGAPDFMAGLFQDQQPAAQPQTSQQPPAQPAPEPQPQAPEPAESGAFDFNALLNSGD